MKFYISFFLMNVVPVIAPKKINLENGKNYDFSISIQCACGGDSRAPDLYVKLNQIVTKNGKITYQGKNIIPNTRDRNGKTSNNYDYNNIGYDTYDTSSTKKLQVEVWDRDVGSDDFLGETDYFDMFSQLGPYLINPSNKNGKKGEIKDCAPNECAGNNRPQVVVKLKLRK